MPVVRYRLRSGPVTSRFERAAIQYVRGHAPSARASLDAALNEGAVRCSEAGEQVGVVAPFEGRTHRSGDTLIGDESSKEDRLDAVRSTDRPQVASLERIEGVPALHDRIALAVEPRRERHTRRALGEDQAASQRR